MNDDLPTGRAAPTAPEETPLLLTVEEACDALKISRSSLYLLIRKKRLKTVNINRRRLIAPADLNALIDQLREEGGAND